MKPLVNRWVIEWMQQEDMVNLVTKSWELALRPCLEADGVHVVDSEDEEPVDPEEIDRELAAAVEDLREDLEEDEDSDGPGAAPTADQIEEAAQNFFSLLNVFPASFFFPLA